MNTPKSKAQPLPAKTIIEKLCLNCGICCNGVLFRDVEFQAGEDSGKLRQLGLPVKTGGGKVRFDQPCAALEGCFCRVYAQRPLHCRNFECRLFKSVAQGQTEVAAALRIIGGTLQQAGQVRELLRRLGNAGEDKALTKRFQSVVRRVESGNLTDEEAEDYGQLTLAVHQLNFRLSEAFYPGAEN